MNLYLWELKDFFDERNCLIMFIVEQDRELVLSNSFNLNSLIEINEHDSWLLAHLTLRRQLLYPILIILCLF